MSPTPFEGGVEAAASAVAMPEPPAQPRSRPSSALSQQSSHDLGASPLSQGPTRRMLPSLAGKSSNKVLPVVEGDGPMAGRAQSSGSGRYLASGDVEKQLREDDEQQQEAPLPNVPMSSQYPFPADMHERKQRSYADSPSSKKIRSLGWENSSKTRVQEILKKFDVHEGDSVEYSQVVSLLEHATAHQEAAGSDGGARVSNSFMRWMLVLAFVMVVIALGAMTGLTWLVVSTIKDTEIGANGLLVIKGRHDIVRTDINDMQVVDGVLVGRAAYKQAFEYATMATSAKGGKAVDATDTSVTWQRGGAVDPTSVGVLRTATFKGNRQRFSSRVDIEALMELNYVYIESGTGAEVALMVTGVARVPNDNSVWGNVVRIISSAGTLTLDDTIVHFSDDIAPVFAEAGFAVTSNTGARRSLLGGSYTLYGYFSSIQNISSFDPVDVSKPKLPTKDYTMAVRVYEQCTLPDEPTVDRCLYDPTAAGTVSAATHHRRRELLAADSGSNVEPRDMPGVEEIGGVRYMVHRRRMSYLGKLVRSVATFAAAPAYQRVQVMDTASGAVSEWQEEVHPEDAELDAGGSRGYCNSFTLPSEHLTQLADLNNMAAADFKYMGDEQKLGMAARHFVYTAKQAAAVGNVKSPATISIEYWDTIEGFKPIAFELVHPVLGNLKYVVEDLKVAITAASFAASAFAAPKPSTCSVGCMPRLGSAFTVPAPAQRWTTLAAGSSKGRRSLASVTAYEATRRFLLADSSSAATTTESDLCSADPTALPTVALGGGCSLEWGVRASKFVSATASCGRDSGALDKLPALKLGGRASVDTCSGTTDGCLLAALTVPQDCCSAHYGNALSVYNGLGAGAAGTLKLCGAFDWAQRQGCMMGASTSAASSSGAASWAGRVETYAALRYTTSSVWLGEAGFESYLGVNFGLFQSFHSVGAVDLDRDDYLAGSSASAKQSVAAVPSVVNTYNEQIRVGDVTYPAEYYAFVGYWGDWGSWAYCYTDAGAGSMRGMPIKGLRVRMDEYKAGKDNTGLNAVEFGCEDGSSARPSNGMYGTWSEFSSCPAGTYAMAARMRVADPAADGDDNTAVNSIELRCSDSTVLSPDQGYEGGWRDWVSCPSDAYVCGARARMQPDQGDAGDNSALNGMQLSCCRSHPSGTA